MAAFRFRAAAALDLRHQQEREAAAAVSRAEADSQAANALHEAARVSRASAQVTLDSEQCRGTDIETLLWHRNWITALTATVAQRSADVERLDAIARTAQTAWRDARRQRLALERLRERALARHRDLEASHERKTIDELARIRFALRDAEATDEEQIDD
jgi:flagellar export protein FliJ